ncbi:MAG: putative sulfate exporter family transporter [Acidobacteria bacterium]|nr:putative sulfate exporter family transporter [Acidobacteriota bacterium]MCI0621484.1 putative sulfate exporter family transporter [Acidobacteriota bacterium]MCI0722384.1 putative sulfate exporter family transporter [Acidobacteriota bacterium]
MKRNLSILPGLALLVGCAIVVRQYAEPWIRLNWKWGFDVLHLNAMMLSFLLGITLGNLFPRPAWAAQGVASSAMVLKTGVVLMGSLYSFAEIGKIGRTSLLMIFFFVFGTFAFVLWLGKLLQTPRTLTGVLACGCGICGVSAEIAAAPLLGATAAELAYCIGVTLGFGLLEVVTYPAIGTLLGLSSSQFGGWAGTGILNSAQVLAVALAYEKNLATLETVKVAEIFNITRVLFLPVLLVILAFYASSRQALTKADSGKLMVQKFPVFIFGFLAMTGLTSAGVFSGLHLQTLRSVMLWCFSVGLIGLGVRTDFGAIRQTGGKPLLMGVSAGVLKTLASLAAVLLLLK